MKDNIYRVTSSSLNVRVGPGIKSQLSSNTKPLQKGEVVFLTDIKLVDGTFWGLTIFGWVSMRFLETYDAPIGELALHFAKGQLGKLEFPRGSNWGPDVEKYLKSVGINVPAPWCMAFVYWCVNEACKAKGVTNKLLQSGHVLTVGAAASRRGVTTSRPRPGDIFIMNFGGGRGHTGFCSDIAPKFMFNTIEGNSNDEGSREGHEVCAKPGGRAISSCKYFIRLI
jgi:hypothetical protein